MKIVILAGGQPSTISNDREGRNGGLKLSDEAPWRIWDNGK